MFYSVNPKDLGDSLYNIKLSDSLNGTSIYFVNDSIRMICIQFIIQFLYFMKKPSEHPLLSETFLELILYMILGIGFYWFVIERLIRIS